MHFATHFVLVAIAFAGCRAALECPEVPKDTVGTCVNTCAGDDDCKPRDKCCSNGCGWVCTRAEGEATCNLVDGIVESEKPWGPIPAEGGCPPGTSRHYSNDSVCCEVVNPIWSDQAACPQPGHTPSTQHKCGRGFGDCPVGWECINHPADRWAACCPVESATIVTCATARCSAGYTCVAVEPEDCTPTADNPCYPTVQCVEVIPDYCEDTLCPEDKECKYAQVETECLCANDPNGRCDCKEATYSYGPACVPTDTTDCSKVSCKEECTYGRTVDENGCEMCHCKPPGNLCRNHHCDDNQECVLEQVQCVTAPCYPVATCKPRPGECEVIDGVVTSNRPRGPIPEDGCSSGSSADYNDGTSCCSVTAAYSDKPACPSLWHPYSTKYKCKRGHEDYCPDGWMCSLHFEDEWGVCCPNQTHMITCANVLCDMGTAGCVMTEPEDCEPSEETNFCYPTAQCEAVSEPEPDYCHNIQCPADQECKWTLVEHIPECECPDDDRIACDCPAPTLSFEAACVPTNPTNCPQIKCAEQCEYGRTVDKNNCETCSCKPPGDLCRNMWCDESEECRLEQGHCDRGPCYPEPTCVPKPDVCSLPMDVGPCDAEVPAWAYDSHSGQCVTFNYGGCEGNGNRFRTEMDCARRCPVYVDSCYMPRVQGPCEAAITAWGYDHQIRQCVQFMYGGCQGNQNNFDTKEECDKTCPKLKCESSDGVTVTSDIPWGPVLQDGSKCPPGTSSHVTDGLCCPVETGMSDLPVCPRPNELYSGIHKCGRGIDEQCPVGWQCAVHATDRWAVCCPVEEQLISCANVDCTPDNPVCIMEEPEGCEPTQENPCYHQPVCVPLPPTVPHYCHAMTCLVGTVCKWGRMPSRCRECDPENGRECQPCPVQYGPMCVPDTPIEDCGDMSQCREVCPHGHVVDGEGCPGCECNPPPHCPGSCLGLHCHYSDIKDEEGCPVCVCVDPVDPCENYDCKEGYVCVLHQAICACAEDQLDCLCPELEPIPGCVPEPENKCDQPIAPGSCKAHFPSWGFNSTSQQCEEFIYGGCEGNENRFETENDCEEECPTMRVCGPVCLIYCEHGNKMDSFGCPTCECNPAPSGCEDMDCDDSDGEVCKIVEVTMCPSCLPETPPEQCQCSTTYVPGCVNKYPSNCPELKCDLKCKNRQVVDFSGCPVCKCVDPEPHYCKDITCDDGLVCKWADTGLKCPPCAPGVECPPCPDIFAAMCVPDTPVKDCGDFSKCEKNCEWGFAVDTEGCRFCDVCAPDPVCSPCGRGCKRGTTPGPDGCAPCDCEGDSAGKDPAHPCEDHKCEDGYVCIAPKPLCECPFGALDCPCSPPIAQCVEMKEPTNEFDVCKLPMESGSCRALMLQWGFNPKTEACEKFNYGGCEGNENRFDSLEACQKQCGKKEGGVPACPLITCPDLDCKWGPAKSADGCFTCKCHNPCETLKCPPGQLCRPEDLCFPIQPLCPPVCDLQCDFGKKKDSNSCEICECNTGPVKCETDEDCNEDQKCHATQMSVCPDCVDCACTAEIVYTCVARELNDQSGCKQECGLTCETGLLYDVQGCPTCRCSPPVKPLCPARVCNQECDYGYVIGKDGCETCICKHPCDDVKCNEDEECKIVNVNDCKDLEDASCLSGLKPTCVLKEPVCKEACPLADCANGLLAAATGCSTCTCSPFPTSDFECPQVKCSSQCHFGYKMENGCQTCDCNPLTFPLDVCASEQSETPLAPLVGADKEYLHCGGEDSCPLGSECVKYDHKYKPYAVCCPKAVSENLQLNKIRTKLVFEKNFDTIRSSTTAFTEKLFDMMVSFGMKRNKLKLNWLIEGSIIADIEVEVENNDDRDKVEDMQDKAEQGELSVTHNGQDFTASALQLQYAYIDRTAETTEHENNSVPIYIIITLAVAGAIFIAVVLLVLYANRAKKAKEANSDRTKDSYYDNPYSYPSGPYTTVATVGPNKSIPPSSYSQSNFPNNYNVYVRA